MKRIFFISLIIMLPFLNCKAQESPIPLYPADRFLFDIFTDIWQDIPEDMNTSTINRGINLSMFQDFSLGNTSFSLAAGLGFTGHNLYSDNYYEVDDTEDYYTFIPIDESLGEIKKNKLSLNYLNIPLEFRYRSRTLPTVIRASVGFRAGLLINAHTKHRFVYDDEGYPEEIKYKENKLDNINTFQMGVTARIGYGRFNLYGYLPLNDIFYDNPAEDMRPVSVGISLVIY